MPVEGSLPASKLVKTKFKKQEYEEERFLNKK